MDGHYIDSYYTRSIGTPPCYETLDQTIRTNVCIIGGGLAGIATAFALKERGVETVLLESNRLGWGASGRNGGLVLTGYAADTKKIIQKVGMANAKALYGLTIEATRIIRDRISKYAIPCLPVDGSISASWFRDTAPLADDAAFLTDVMGDEAIFWDTDEIRDTYRTNRYHGAIFFPRHFHMNPLIYLRHIAAQIHDKSHPIFENSPAISITENKDGLIIRTAKGTVKADHLVYCGSAYSNGVIRKFNRHCMPVQTFVLKTAPLADEDMKAAIRKPYAVCDTRWASDYYRVLEDNSLLWGGRVHLGENPGNIKEAILADITKVYPQLSGKLSCEVFWGGRMGYNSHKMPSIGRLRPHIWHSTHYGGNGLGPTTAGGELIADGITGKNDNYKLFAPFGHGLPAGGKTGAVIGQAVYQSWCLADRLHTALK